MANEEPLDRVLLPGEQTVTHEKPTCKRYLRELCGDREDVVGGGRLLASNRSNSGLELTFVVLANSAHGANDEQGCGSRLEPRPFWAPSKPRTPRRGGPRGAQCGAARPARPGEEFHAGRLSYTYGHTWGLDEAGEPVQPALANGKNLRPATRCTALTPADGRCTRGGAMVGTAADVR